MATPPGDGLLLVDKPAGMTSHDVVDRARRALHTRRIGHAGTLDPFATGLLILLVGRATRLLPYVDGEPKVYDATIRFGAETATDDLTGDITRTAPPPAPADVARALGTLTGEMDQVPPDYSAKQVAGRRAYAAARAGQSLDLAPARVTVHSWEVRGWDGADLRVRIVCAGGTYVRALARDLGRALGSAAHLTTLRRVASGRFSVDEARTVGAIGAEALRPAVDALPAFPRITLDAGARIRVGRGMSIVRDSSAAGDRAALLDADGALVAIARREGDAWQPKLVLVDA